MASLISLHFGGLWDSVVTSIYYKKKLLWLWVRATLVCVYKDKDLEIQLDIMMV